MKKFIEELTQNVIEQNEIRFEDAIMLINIDDEDLENIKLLFEGANKIRKHFTGNNAELCTIMNVKSGRCSEDCRYCAQSVHYNTGVDEYELVDYTKVLKKAKEVERIGAHRFSLVSSGRGASGKDFEKLLDIYRRLKKDTNLKICSSHGIINLKQAKKLKKAGVDRYHHNVETSSNFYSEICTTHSYKDRIETIKNVKKAGLNVCCGGIIGLGESPMDRVRMFFEIRDLNIKSIPINILTPIKGTPMESNKMLDPIEALKSMAVCRFIIPSSYIRYAGGRKAIKDKQDIGFRGGVNSALIGNYLTTTGSNVKADKNMIIKQGFVI